jgi:hypothetical protein
MIDYKIVTNKIIKSITEFTFEFDIEKIKKDMELQDVSKEELKKIGQVKVTENFNKGLFNIKMLNGAIIDSKSIHKDSLEKNIKEPVLPINTNFKFVKWIVKKDFTIHQIKKQIRKQITSNSEIDLIQLKKELLNKKTGNDDVDGYINGLPIKSSNNVNEGMFYIQSSCSTDLAITMVYEVLFVLEKETISYVKTQIKNDYRKFLICFIFLLLVYALWFTNKESKILSTGLSTTVAFVLFSLSFIVIGLRDHTIFNTLLNKKKAEKKYAMELYEKVYNE